MRLRDRPQHFQKHLNARTNIEVMLIAILINLGAIYVFENKIWLSSTRYPSVNEISDVFMGEKRKNFTLSPESLFAGLSHQREIQELHGDSAFKKSIVALGKPDTSHAALANLRDQAVNTKGLTRQR